MTDSSYLDLAYITDRIIVMGYPSKGLEGLYRNRREDAKKFLDHRHSNNYWVFNFCPVVENEYPAEVFDGRVSRYPFPDHQYVTRSFELLQCARNGELGIASNLTGGH